MSLAALASLGAWVKIGIRRGASGRFASVSNSSAYREDVQAARSGGGIYKWAKFVAHTQAIVFKLVAEKEYPNQRNKCSCEGKDGSAPGIAKNGNAPGIGKTSEPPVL